jgi:hypothetical protein
MPTSSIILLRPPNPGEAPVSCLRFCAAREGTSIFWRQGLCRQGLFGIPLFAYHPAACLLRILIHTPAGAASLDGIWYVVKHGGNR